MPAPQNVPQQNPYGPLVTFKSTDILPPSAIYVSPQDQIRLNIVNPTVAVNVNVFYRLLRADGTIVTTQQTYASPIGGSNQTIPPSEGFLLSMLINADSVSRGQCFLKAWLAPAGGAGGFITAHMFMQGYVSSTDQLCFPQSPTESSLNGRGWLRVVHIADVIGGTPSWVVPNGVHWLMRNVNGQFQASGAGAARSLSLTCQDGSGNEAFQIGAAATVAPGGSNFLSWGAGLTLASAGLFQTMGGPREFVLTQGFVLSLNTVVLDVGDKWSILNLSVEEFVGL